LISSSTHILKKNPKVSGVSGHDGENDDDNDDDDDDGDKKATNLLYVSSEL